MSTGYALTDTDRRLANLVQIGKIKAVDLANGLAQVDLDGPETASIPWTATRAGGDRTWWAPEVGEQVVVAAVGGELGNGVILGCLYQDAHPEPADSADVHRTIYADGTVIEYDRSSHRLLADINDTQVQADRASILLKVGSVQISITSAGVAITGATLTHNGVSISSSHLHSGVQPGSGNTGQPV